MSAESPHRVSQGSSKSGPKSSSPVPSPGSWNHVERGRSKVRRPSNPTSDNGFRKRYERMPNTVLPSSFGKPFHVEKRWKLVREMGSGAYGYVISASDEISGETVAIKMVTRVLERVQLAKRALREITLLRHFASHENITGLIDVDAVSPDFGEIYIFMEPMEADLHQIIKSGQSLTNEHVQYFMYQILRGMKYVHSASVIHRDLKPGNLLVNSDYGENATHLTEYVATRWYRAPEIMLAFNRYSTATMVCKYLMRKLSTTHVHAYPVDQLNKILEVLGTPTEAVIQRIGSDKAQAYIRSLPIKKITAFQKLFPSADSNAIDLLTKMLSFDPGARISVEDALAHPWLAAYHDANDEPVCSVPFEKWRDIEKLETIEDFQKALWDEIEDYRREVRGISVELDALGYVARPKSPEEVRETEALLAKEHNGPDLKQPQPSTIPQPSKDEMTECVVRLVSSPSSIGPEHVSTPVDPLVSYARRSIIMGHSRQSSAFPSPVMHAHQGLPSSYMDGPLQAEPGTSVIAFPTRGRTDSYVFPARSRTASMAGGELPRQMLRTLSTVSIHESIDGLPGGMAGVGEMGKYILGGGRTTTGADAPPSELPRDFAIEEGEEGTDEDGERGRQAERRFRLE
ncbi:hypothetical protein HWV62_25324 [Athelia sp. TMB]|nr:hypothetical protein HWV62_25324 [Athelia sp. TMB]